MDLRDIYRPFPVNTEEYIFFSAIHETFLKIDHIPRNKASLESYKKVEIARCMQTGYHTLKVNLNNRNNRKNTNLWEYNASLLSEKMNCSR